MISEFLKKNHFLTAYFIISNRTLREVTFDSYTNNVDDLLKIKAYLLSVKFYSDLTFYLSSMALTTFGILALTSVFFPPTLLVGMLISAMAVSMVADVYFRLNYPSLAPKNMEESSLIN